MPVDNRLLSLPNAADYLGLSRAALAHAVETGELRLARETGDDVLLFDVADLDALVDSRQARAIVTGKLTMSLQLRIDIPALLRTMVAMPDVRQAATALADAVATLAGARCRAVAVLRVAESGPVRMLALSHFPGRETFAEALDGPAGDVALSDLPADLQAVAIGGERPFATHDIAALLEPLMPGSARRLVQLLEIRGGLVLPMLPIGGLHRLICLLLDCDPRKVRQETRDAIAALSVQASIALEAVRLREDVLHRATRAEALYGTARLLARSEDSGSLLETIAALATRLLATDAGGVLIYRPEQDAFWPGASVGLDATARHFTANLSAAYLLGRAAGMTRPLQVADASHTATLSLPRLAGNRRTLAAICAPIVHRGTLLGAIEVYSTTPRTFSEDDSSLLETFAHQAAVALNTVHSQEVRRRALLGAVEALASANEARDGDTGEHCKRLGRLAMLLARALGFSEEEVERIRLAAALHDIGKIAVPDAILRKPGPLTDDERAIVQRHPRTGAEIVARVPELADVALMVGAHQERWDGGGYPTGQAGNEIPIGARIIAVVDTYAALVEDRPYRRGRSHVQALEILAAGSGSQLDPAIVATFIDIEAAVARLMAGTDALPQGSDAGPGRRIVPDDGRSRRPSSGSLPGRWQPHRADELAALTDLIRAVATARDPRGMYDEITRRAGDLLDTDAILLLVADPRPVPRETTARMRRAPCFPPIGLPVEAGIVDAVARTRRSLLVDDYVTYAHQCPLPNGDRPVNAPRSVIAVPIVDDNRLLGIFSLQALHPGAYEERHVDLVDELAVHIGLALRRGGVQPPEPDAAEPGTRPPDQGGLLPRQRAEVARARSENLPLALLAICMDNVPLIPGAAGNELLHWLGRFLSSRLPPAAYLTHDEDGTFTAILPGIPAGDAQRIAAALRAELARQPVPTASSHAVLLSFGAGVAAIEPGSAGLATAEELLAIAKRGNRP
jgi:putative nucleotidyltransferase with HDIG domain